MFGFKIAKQACFPGVFQRPIVTGLLGETLDIRRFALGREPRMGLCETGLEGEYAFDSYAKDGNAAVSATILLWVDHCGCWCS